MTLPSVTLSLGGGARRRKLAIAMPIEGTPENAMVHLAPQLTLNKLANAVFMDGRGDTMPIQVGSYDVTRARDRYTREFLHGDRFRDCTDLLHWDSDVNPRDLEVINRLMATDHDVVGCPYRRKKDGEDYPYSLGGRVGSKRIDVVRGCVEVEWLAFGFMLTSRAALQKMWDAYHASRWWFDQDKAPDGTVTLKETVGMFDQIYTDVRPGPDGQPWRTKTSEDYGFCESYRKIGGRVMMFVGEGSPVDHIGEYVFKGTREGLAGEAANVLASRLSESFALDEPEDPRAMPVEP